MMAQNQKHLHELLQEDQEPFVLKNYIAGIRDQFKKSPPKTQIQVKKRKPISQNSNFPSNFRKNACFLSFHDSPDPRKSPLFDFSSPAKSPIRGQNQNAIFINIPARTTSLLLEAALRIQKSKQQSKNNGIFGFFLKRLSKKSNGNSKISGDKGGKASVKDILRWDSSVGSRKSFHQSRKSNSAAFKDKSDYELEFSRSCNGSSRSSTIWSETNEEKSLDLDSNSSQSEDFCESPFHFVLQRSPSSGHRTPVFSSPATSPSRLKRQNYDVESLKKLQAEEVDEEEEKEQCSPVSVLDTPFEDDDDEHVDDDHEYSYAVVQRAKKQLLQKLRSFEKLAELDPIELEKRMSEEEEDQKEDEGYLDHDDQLATSECEMDIDDLVHQVLISSFQDQKRIPEGMEQLVFDLIAEEEAEWNSSELDREVVAKRVCKRMESWKDVESNTIDMMVGEDFRSEVYGWKRSNQEEISEIGVEVESAIFGLLMKELAEELVG